MLVQNVKASLEPLLLFVRAVETLHDFADFHGGFPLVDRFIRMPKHYEIIANERCKINDQKVQKLTEEKTFPGDSEVLLLCHGGFWVDQDPSLVGDEQFSELGQTFISQFLL